MTIQPQIFAGVIVNFLTELGLPYVLVFTLIFGICICANLAGFGCPYRQTFLSGIFFDDSVDEDNMNPFLKVVTNKYFASIITLVLAYLLTQVGYAEIWPLFGSANQLLSVLALIACSVFLKKTKR